MWMLMPRLVAHRSSLLQRSIVLFQSSTCLSSGMPFSSQTAVEASLSKDGMVAKRLLGASSFRASKVLKRSFASSVDVSETVKFAAMAETWWDCRGPFKPLHAMNPVRLSFIRAALCRHFGKDPELGRPLEGLHILDVGCGGGLACEPLARMGAQVIGIDAVEKNVSVAAVHAAKDPATAVIQYQCATAEQLVQEKETFDVVLALEIIEHVADPKEFCESLAALAKDGGIVVVSTVNRSIPAYGLAILAAEYVLGWVPRGTHDWSKFVKPEELALIMNQSSLLLGEMAGMVYNPLTRDWHLSDDTNVNYIGYGIKQAQ